MADWTSMLPGAPPMANPQVAFQSARSSRLDAEGKALENRKALYEQELQRTTQALFSQSIDESGKPNLDRFLQLAAKSPFGAAAHAQAIASLGSQLDVTKKGAETAVMLGANGIETPWSQRKPSDAIRQDTSRTPAIPEKGLAEGIQGMRYTPPKAESADTDEMTPAKIADLSKRDLDELHAGLNASGFPVGKHDFVGMAKALKTGTAAEVSALTKGTDPMKPTEGIAMAATAKAMTPKTALEYRANVIAKGRETLGQRLGQSSAEFGLKKAKQDQEQEQDPIQFYRNGPDKLAANKGNIGEIQKLYGKRGVIESAMSGVDHLMERVKKGEFNGKPDAFNAETAGIQQAIGYTEDANTEGGRATLFSPFRSSKSFGAIVNEGGGPIDILSKMAKNSAAAQEQQEYLDLMRGTLKTLRTSGVNEGSIKGLPRLSDVHRKPSDKPGGRAEPTYRRGKVE